MHRPRLEKLEGQSALAYIHTPLSSLLARGERKIFKLEHNTPLRGEYFIHPVRHSATA